VYLVLAGEVGLLLPVSSTHAFAFRATKGLLVGFPAAFSDEPYSMTAVACNSAELGVMSSEKFCKMIASNGRYRSMF
jgi:CRP-like cAMP-binding protein